MPYKLYNEGNFAIVSGTPAEVLTKLRDDGVFGSNRVVGMTKYGNTDVIVMYWTGGERGLITGCNEYWNFNKRVGDSVFNSGYQGYSATLVSGATVSGTDVNNVTSNAAIILSGASIAAKQPNMFQYVSLPSKDDINALQKGTVCGWIKTDWINSGMTIYEYSKTSEPNVYVRVRLTPTNNLEYTFRNSETLPHPTSSNYFVLSGSSVVLSGVWTHFGVTSDGAKVRLYVNGVEEATTLSSGANTGQWFGDIVTTSGTFSRHLGAHIVSGGFYESRVGDAFTGRMDNVRVVSYPLSGDDFATYIESKL